MVNPVKVGSQFTVNPKSAEGQYEPAVTGLANGKFAVAWTDQIDYLGQNFTRSGDVHVQIYNAEGSRSGKTFIANKTLPHLQDEAAITYLNNGGLVVAWRDASGTRGDADESIKAQLFSASGGKVGSEFRVNTTTEGTQEDPELATLTNGRFVAVWTDGSGTSPDTESGAIRGQVFTAKGAKSGTEFVINTTTASNQYEPEVTNLTDGRFAVSWTSFSSGVYYQTIAQLFDASGAKLGSEITVAGAPLDSSLSSSIAGLANGNVIVIGNVGQASVVAGIYDIAGALVGSSSQVNDPALSDNIDDTAVAALLDGRVVVVWSQASETSPGSFVDEIHARILNSDGSADSDDFIVNTTVDDVSEPTVDVLADGRFVVAWRWDSQSSATYEEVQSQIWDPRTAAITLAGSKLADQYVGTSFGDALSGAAGADRLNGKDGADTINGGKGNDTLIGSAGDDTFVFGVKPSAASVDTIADFQHDHDVIELSRSAFHGLANGGSLSGEAFYAKGGAIKAHDANDRLIYNKTNGNLYYDYDGKDGADAVLFAKLSNHPGDFSQADIVIV